VQQLQVSESARALQDALASLDPVLSATLLLVDQEGESCGAVAKAMDAAVGTVYWRLNKARKQLRQALEQRGEARPARSARVAAQGTTRKANEEVPR
jgi:RNA polymerase sigma-70 factor (ECF subfamily)